jgi:hypothetical protein
MTSNQTNPKTAQEIISEAADYLGITEQEFVDGYKVAIYNEALTAEETAIVDGYLNN